MYWVNFGSFNCARIVYCLVGVSLRGGSISGVSIALELFTAGLVSPCVGSISGVSVALELFTVGLVSPCGGSISDRKVELSIGMILFISAKAFPNSIAFTAASLCKRSICCCLLWQ